MTNDSEAPAGDLKYLGLVSGHADGGPVRLQLALPSGRVREAHLDRRDLLRLIQRAAAALEHLDREAAR